LVSLLKQLLKMTGFIVQARTGSTRLPNKILSPFYKKECILDIMLSQLCTHFPNVPLVLATSTSSADASLEEFTERYKGIEFFRGSENDVLERSMKAAQAFGIDNIIRVCSDNPFLQTQFVQDLIDADADADYISYQVDNLPTIRTHYGLFAERVSLSALEKAYAQKPTAFYREHVTNFIYGHPELFSLHWLEIGNQLKGLEDLRLTIDDPQDFETAQKIYSDLYKGDKQILLSDLKPYLAERPDELRKMNENKLKYSK